MKHYCPSLDQINIELPISNPHFPPVVTNQVPLQFHTRIYTVIIQLMLFNCQCPIVCPICRVTSYAFKIRFAHFPKFRATRKRAKKKNCVMLFNKLISIFFN